ncbi:metal ABC transporter permease [Patescibacteria group bacterium]|nr:MAG: metal ABC transporter permease [Patescibacteria group bacterium]
MEPLSFVLADPVSRAFAAGMIIAPLIGTLGVFAALKRMALFGEGIGHASLAGVAVAVIGGVSALPVALAWGLCIAYAMYRLERSTRLPSDTILAILFTTSMAVGIVLFGALGGAQDFEALEEALFGSILSVGGGDLALTALAALGIGAWVIHARRSLTFLSLSQESAAVSGVNVRLHTLLLYLSLAAAIVFGVKLVGLILVSALLIIPSAAARQVARTFRGTLIMTVLLSELAMILGLFASIRFDLPSGAPIVLAASGLFAACAIVGRVRGS